MNRYEIRRLTRLIIVLKNDLFFWSKRVSISKNGYHLKKYTKPPSTEGKRNLLSGLQKKKIAEEPRCGFIRLFPTHVTTWHKNLTLLERHKTRLQASEMRVLRGQLEELEEAESHWSFCPVTRLDNERKSKLTRKEKDEDQDRNGRSIFRSWRPGGKRLYHIWGTSTLDAKVER